MTVAGKLSNADAIFVGVRSCCLLPSHRNNFVEDQVRAVEKGAISSTLSNKSLSRAIAEGTRRIIFVLCNYTVTLYSQSRCVKTFRKLFSCLRHSDRREGPCLHVMNKNPMLKLCAWSSCIFISAFINLPRKILFRTECT